MTSSLGWIDFSSEHRDRVRSVIDLLSAKGVVDELGIGVIRDAFADEMFPGISTVQTRPKYFFLTAFLIRDYLTEERKKRKPRPLERYLEEREKECRIHLVAKHGSGRRSLGIIGGTFGVDRNRDVVRRPSSVYWNGLRQFGFVSPPHLSLAEFARRASDDGHRLHSLLQEAGDDRGDDADAIQNDYGLRINAPQTVPGYWEDLSIELLPEEAEFLRQSIVLHCGESLLGQILRSDEAVNQVSRLAGTSDFGTFSELPFLQKLRNGSLLRLVEHARDFWTLLEGAHILYNCLLQEAGFGTPELRDSFEGEWEEWRGRMRDFAEPWEPHFLWNLTQRHGSQVGEPTRRFVDAWIHEARRGTPDRGRCVDLVRQQERFNKGGRARLRSGHVEAVNQRIGFDGLNYRLPQVRQLVSDIRQGERRTKEDR
jgi:hypothetical protein